MESLHVTVCFGVFWGVFILVFFLVTYSWGVHWGEHGLFRIRRGTNECEIEDEVAAGVPLLEEGQGCEEAVDEAKGRGGG